MTIRFQGRKKEAENSIWLLKHKHRHTHKHSCPQTSAYNVGSWKDLGPYRMSEMTHINRNLSEVNSVKTSSEVCGEKVNLGIVSNSVETHSPFSL